MTAAFIVIAALALVGLGVRLYMDRDAENRLLPGDDISFAGLRDPLPGNAFLACPRGHCGGASAMPSPDFAAPAARLYQELLRLLAAEPRVRILSTDPANTRVAALQRSAVFRFPDIIVAEVVALGPDRSSLALYSRSRYGRGDFGVNRNRVTSWLRNLEQTVRQTGPPWP